MLQRERGDSPVIAHTLMVALVIVIALIILLLCLAMLGGFFPKTMLAPPLIKVTSVIHTSPGGTMNLASRIFIQNTDSVEYKNGDLIAVLLRNGKEIYAVINTLHGEGFIPTQHFGVATMGGAGCRGDYFSPGEMIEINLKNGQYRPGDLVELRIYQKSDKEGGFPVIGNVADFSYMQEWVQENFYSNHPGYRIISQHAFQA